MLTLRCWLLAIGLAACSEDRIPQLFDQLPLDVELAVGLDAPAQLARDKYGIPHIAATSVRDAGFVQGYVTAHDRLPQLDMMRRFASGTLAEVFGDDPAVVQTDFEMRMHRIREFARATRDGLDEHQHPRDQQLIDLLEGYAAGVNAYRTDLVAGKWTLDPAIAAVFRLDAFAEWTPIDSLAVLRFHTLAASWTAPGELAVDELYSNLVEHYDAETTGARGARAGISRDLVRFEPVNARSTIDGFPDAGTNGALSSGTELRPGILPQTYDLVRGFFRSGTRTGPEGAPGPHAFMHPNIGASSWVVGPERTSSPPFVAGPAMLASDHHVQLTNPSLYYPTHLIIADTGLDVVGLTIPGIPGVLQGSNGVVAWAGTPARHDVNDTFVEQGPSEIYSVMVDVGGVDGIQETKLADYELVDGNPVIPKFDPATNTVVPRLTEQKLAVQYTGYARSFELDALWELAHATSVPSGLSALATIQHGDQSWMLIDDQRLIAWTTEGMLPQRPATAFDWDADDPTKRKGTAPFFVVDGNGMFDWMGPMQRQYVPRGRAQGFVVSTGADPVGATFDNNPVNGPVVATDQRLYTGASYAAGFRQERIAALLEASSIVSEATMERIQHDTRSNAGAALRDSLVTALDRALKLSGLPAGDFARLLTARDLLSDWTFATPTSSELVPALPDSAATALFNAWMGEFLRLVLCDELVNQTPVPQACALERYTSDHLVRIVHAILVTPTKLKTELGEPIMCDDFDSATTDSCTTMVARAMLQAMTSLESLTASSQPGDWRWGDLHQLVIEPLFPAADLTIPGPGELATTGFPRAGDQFAVNGADHGYTGTLSQQAGPAYRFLAIANPGERIELRLQLPGGAIFDRRDPHYRDLLDRYYLKETHFVAPFSVQQIIDNGEHRWDFR